MNTESCLLCDKIQDYPQADNTEYICGSCVQLLLITTKEEKIKRYNIAIDKGYGRRAKAVKKFIIKGEYEDGKQQCGSPRNIRKRIKRKRSYGNVRGIKTNNVETKD